MKLSDEQRNCLIKHAATRNISNNIVDIADVTIIPKKEYGIFLGQQNQFFTKTEADSVGDVTVFLNVQVVEELRTFLDL